MKHFFALAIWIFGALLLNLTAYGQAPAWQRALAAAQSGGDEGLSVGATATDAAGNVYIAGAFNGTVSFGATALTFNNTSRYAGDFYVAKWSASTGTFLWAVRGGGSNKANALSLAVNGSNLYVAGVFSSPTLTLGPLTLANATPLISASNDVFVAKLTDNGTSAAFVWAQQIGGRDYESMNKLAVIGPNVYISGSFDTPSLNFGATILTNAGAGNGIGTSDVFVAKLVDAGTTASFAWAQRAGGPFTDFAGAMAVTASGNVYLAGGFDGDAAFGSTTLSNYSLYSGNDIFVAKLTDNGTTANFVWAQRAGGPRADDIHDMAVNGSNVYITGCFLGDSAKFGNTKLTLTGAPSGISQTVRDLYIAKLTDAGTTANFTWAVQAGGTENDEAQSIAVNGNSLYIAGAFASSAAAFGTTTLTNAGPGGFNNVIGYDYDAFVAKLTDAGNTATFAWAQRAGGTGSDVATGLAISGANLFVGGRASVPVSFGSLSLPGPAGTRAIFLASLTDLTLLATTAAHGSLSFSLAPNPARTSATVLLPAVPSAPTAILTLRDALGRVVRTQMAPAGARVELDLRGLAPGLYAVQVRAGSTAGTQRLVVE